MIVAILLAALLTLLGDPGPGTLAPDPQPQPGTVHAVSVPLQMTPATEFPLADSATWHNWHHDACDKPGYWPMVYHRGDITRYPLPANCADRPLLMLNERNETPQVAAELLHEFRNHPGGLWCCGTLWHTRDMWYVLATLGTYYAEHGSPPPLDGLHIHVYVSAGLEDGIAAQVRPWRALADLFGWQIAVTEYACLGEPEQIARCMPRLTAILERELEPVALFWFSWRFVSTFPAASLVDADGNYTVVGEAWQDMVNVAGAQQFTLYAPGVVQ